MTPETVQAAVAQPAADLRHTPWARINPLTLAMSWASFPVNTMGWSSFLIASVIFGPCPASNITWVASPSTRGGRE